MSRYKPKHLADKKICRNRRTVKNAAEEKASWDFYSFVQCITESVLMAFLLLVFFINVSVVAGSSMNPTLKDGDRILVSHIGYTLQH
ncbi:MAG: S26 family signal peptidase, partial [Ruminiclostridium sp.]|nr:S26 family signal peptidase [Ruminiclostridium sp.]